MDRSGAPSRREPRLGDPGEMALNRGARPPRHYIIEHTILYYTVI